MLKVIGDLSERGIGFFHDREFKYEIVQNSEINVSKGGEVELFVGIKHRYGGNKRYGKILILEENYLAFMVDLVEESQGEFFRNFDNIESIEMNVEFDEHAFLRNMLIGMMDKQFYHVLEFISKPHMFNEIESLYSCGCEPERRVFVDCENPLCRPNASTGKGGVWRFFPSGWWGQEDKYPNGQYLFFRDYFYDIGGEPDRDSVFEQWIYHDDIKRMNTNKYLDSGFVGYNYVNNIYPEQESIMNYRWRYGGYDVTWLEYRLNKTYVYNTFNSWYDGNGYGNTSKLIIEADEQTVKGHTDLAKTDTKYMYNREEHILSELLGPRECVFMDEYNNCLSYRYGEILPITQEDVYIWGEDYTQTILSDNWPDSEVPENRFIVLQNDSFVNLSSTYINSGTFFNLMNHPHSISAADAFFSVEHSDGKIGGRYIYNNGLGNEHRYFMPFRSFLIEQGWSIDDFMSIYSSLMSERKYELREGVSVGTNMRIHDFSEFYDKNHKAPFDGIRFYIPLIPTYSPDTSASVDFIAGKSVVNISQNGEETISPSDSEYITPGQFDMPINKDEFISSIEIPKSMRVLISDYMKIRINIKFKDIFSTVHETKLRISGTDFTYLSEREFEYYE